jgi:hypothetical protein
MKNLQNSNKIKTLIREYEELCKKMQENNAGISDSVHELEVSFINALQEDLPNLYATLYTGPGGDLYITFYTGLDRELEVTVRFSTSTMQKNVSYEDGKVTSRFKNEEYETLDALKKAFNEVETVVNYLNGSRFSKLISTFINEKIALSSKHTYSTISSMRQDLINNIEELLKDDSGDMKLSSTRSIKIESKYLYTCGGKETRYSKSDPESYKIIANYIVSNYVERS